MSFKIIQLTAKYLVQAKHEVYLMSIQTCKPLSKLINKSSFIYWMNKLSHKTDNYVHCRYTQLLKTDLNMIIWIVIKIVVKAKIPPGTWCASWQLR